jgi:hypothetical protein
LAPKPLTPELVMAVAGMEMNNVLHEHEAIVMPGN